MPDRIEQEWVNIWKYLTQRRQDARDIEEVAAIVIDTALQLHRDLGPGLLESAYEAVLAKMLEQKGLLVERQKPVPIHFQGVSLDEGFRLDLLVDGQLIVELKSVENIHPVHPKQLLTYLRLMNLPLGLLINFGAPLLKDGLKRLVNNHSKDYISREGAKGVKNEKQIDPDGIGWLRLQSL